MDKSDSLLKELYSRKALLIINPVSGKRLIVKYIPGIVRKLMDAGYLVTTVVTSRRGEATALAGQLGDDFDLVCCTGGDGTLNETVSGLAEKGIDVPLGYIPCGSTNDFASSRVLSLDIERQADKIASETKRRFDVGRFGEHYFTYVAAFGAFSWLSYTTDQNLKNMLGYSAYIIDAIFSAYKIKPIHILFRDGETVHEGDYIFGAICNSTSVAGAIELSRSIVDMNDGLFEVLLVKMPKTIIELDAIIRGLLTQDYSCPLIDFFQTDSLDIENPTDLEWSLDGECAVGDDNVHFSVMRSFLQLQG